MYSKMDQVTFFKNKVKQSSKIGQDYKNSIYIYVQYIYSIIYIFSLLVSKFNFWREDWALVPTH